MIHSFGLEHRFGAKGLQKEQKRIFAFLIHFASEQASKPSTETLTLVIDFGGCDTPTYRIHHSASFEI